MNTITVNLTDEEINGVDDLCEFLQCRREGLVEFLVRSGLSNWLDSFSGEGENIFCKKCGSGTNWKTSS